LVMVITVVVLVVGVGVVVVVIMVMVVLAVVMTVVEQGMKLEMDPQWVMVGAATKGHVSREEGTMSSSSLLCCSVSETGTEASLFFHVK